ncbi:MAG: restriction endonuclease subunit S [Deltaproteobacteria bacterium]
MLSEDWGVLQLRELGEIVTGTTPSTKDRSFWGGDIPFVTPSDLNGSRYVAGTERYVTQNGADRGRLLPKGAVLVTCIASVGKMGLAASPCITNQQINAIICNKEHDSDYIFFALSYAMERLKLVAGVNVLPIINKTAFGKLKISLPLRKSEQIAISSVLDGVDSVINSSKDALQLALSLKTALLQAIFKKGMNPDGRIRSDDEENKENGNFTKLGILPNDWDAIRLGELCTYITDGTHQATTKQSNGIPFLFVSCIKSGKVDFSKSSFISDSEYKTISIGKEPRADAVLYTVVGSYGNAAIVEGDAPFAFERNIAFLLPNNEGLNPKFLVHLLNSEGGRKQAEIAATGNAQKLISLTALKKIRIAVPKLKEQHRIVEMLEPVDALIDAIEVKLRNQDQLKKSLMHDLLTGTVRVDPKLVL